jgi:hypothetical protein
MSKGRTLSGLAAGILLAGSAYAADPGAAMSGEDITKEIIGKKEWFISPEGEERAGIYNQDGSYVFRNGGGGTWRLDGNTFCEKPEGYAEICGTFHKVGDKSYQLIRSDGSKGVLIKVP